MNLKSIQKNYGLLSLEERAALMFAAILRDDERELDAIVAATPKVSYTVRDFYFFAREINDLHIVNLIERWNQQTLFDTFVDVAEEARDHKKKKRYEVMARVSAYLYVVETDAWEIVGNEYGIDVLAYRKHLANKLSCITFLEFWDEVLRKAAFTEAEAIQYLTEQSIKLKIHTAENRVVNFKTVESVAETYRKQLREYKE
jgi:hypothetical protein